jgi:hypothetical protein
VTQFQIGELVCSLNLPDWLDGPPTPGKLQRRLDGPDDAPSDGFLRLNRGDQALVESAATVPPDARRQGGKGFRLTAA